MELRLRQHAIPVQVHRSELEPVLATRRCRHRQSTAFAGGTGPKLHAAAFGLGGSGGGYLDARLQLLLPIGRLRLDLGLDALQLGVVELDRVLGFFDLLAQRRNEV
jgi:hypothetical protein